MAEEKKSDKDNCEILRNPSELDGVPDLSQLIYLDMPNVLHNLEYRYCKMPTKFCYTSISSILLAINPYENLPIYGQDVINEFHNAAEKGRQVNGRPHPYGVSARAYMRMIQRKCNQSVIVCGESGAGKTETTKLLMRYLAMTAPISAEKAAMNKSSIEEQIIAASPILEAYGNAKTVMNNNSSRFGKFTKLLYNVPENSQKGNILGSSLETYLLEKSRVVFQALNERNYHIFYFLHQGLGKNNVEYGLETIEKFNYTNQGKCFIPFKDEERFRELQESLSMFRIEKDVQDILWKLTAGILNLGNINFIRTGDGFTDIDKKSIKYIEIVSNLWGLKPSELEKRLKTKSLKVKGNKNDIIQNIQFDAAISNRDSIAKGIYENIFLWLCKRINAELLIDDNDDDETKTDEENGKYFIGILDVFGFENFYINSLEQFCINYTNEKLQQYFNFHIIQQEQEEYLKESVFWKPLTIPDNKQYIQLIENQKIGFWTLLDSACNGPSKDDPTAFMQTLFKKHGKNPAITRKTKAGSGNWRGQKPKSQKSKQRRGGAAKFDGFMINHYADDVTYDISSFLIKNIESVHSDTNKMIKKSSISIFKEINGVDGVSRRRGGRNKKKSVTAVFYSGIKRLMKSLNKTEPYFVRCINPNKQKSSKIWTEKIVQHQLKCGGLLEALRVLKLGYPTRVPYQLLFEKYHSSVTNPLIKNMNPEAFSTSLLIAFDVNENDYELGLTKIFFKPSKAAVLDTIMSKAGKPLTKQQNDKITKYIVNKRCKQIIGTVKAFTNLRKLVRLKRAAEEWKEKGRTASILGGTVIKHLYIARKQIRQRKEKHAAILMQTYFRSMYQRKYFIKQCDKIKKSTQIVWISYNSMKQRQGLTQWLDTKVEQRKVEMERLRIEQLEKQKNDEKIAAAAKKANIIVAEEKVAEISKEEQLKILRAEREEQKAKEDEAKRKAEEEEKERLRQEVDARKKEQNLAEKRGSADAEKIEKRLAAEKKEQLRLIAEKNREERERQDEIARTKQKQRRKKKKRIYGGNIDTDMIDDDDDDDDTDHDTDNEYNSDDPDEPEQVEDIKVLLTRFHKIAAMGQLFFRHAGSRTRHKPQDRVVKVSFDHDGKPKEISWGSGSRHIYFDDIMYIAWGHYTPAFNLRKDTTDSWKCFSIVANGGDKILDLEGYSEHITELWVKGLRKLIGHTDEKSDKMARKNFKNLMDNTKQAKKQKANDSKKITDIMRLQQDLFIMSTHTVFRHLEEERIWNIDQSIRQKFAPQQMYGIALKADIPWRQWQAWIREQITTYLRENGGVNVNTDYDQPNFGSITNPHIGHTSHISTISTGTPMIYHNQYPSQSYLPHHIPSNPSQSSININNNQQQQPITGNIAEEEKCTLM